MAKVKMICPFSGNTCKDCAIYRGRHYFLCFSGEYRGRVADAEEPTRTSTALSPEMRSSRKFAMPILTVTHDPFRPFPQKEIDTKKKGELTKNAIRRQVHP